MTYYRTRRNPYHQQEKNNFATVAIAIIVAAVILIGGYIMYCEYKSNQAEKRINDAIRQVNSTLNKWR